ncbi:MAG: hypothetical protein Q9213_003928 [Squamulea squamosa]
MEFPLTLIADAFDEGDLGGYVQKLILRDELSFTNWEIYKAELNHLRKTTGSLGPRSITTPPNWTPDERFNYLCHAKQCYSGLLLEVSTRLKSLELTEATVSEISSYIYHHFESPVEELPRALQSLANVFVGVSNNRNTNHVADILPFTRLPSMQTLRVHRLRGTSITISARCACRSHSISALKKLELLDSSITPRTLALLLGNSKGNSDNSKQNGSRRYSTPKSNLECFIYETECEKLSGYDWEPRLLINVLREHALGSLTQLTIIESSSSKTKKKPSYDSAGLLGTSTRLRKTQLKRGFIGSLNTFTCLQHVHLECYMLIFEHEIGGKPISGGIGMTADMLASFPPVKSIMKLFPPSLQTLKLVQREQTDIQVEQMLAGVVVGCDELPHLTEVSISAEMMVTGERTVCPSIPQRCRRQPWT